MASNAPPPILNGVRVKTCFHFQIFLTMAELNGNGLANFTNQTSYSLPWCSGSWPSTTVEFTTYLFLTTFLLMGNVLLVAVFYRNKTLRTAVHYFIVNMAVSDLILPLIYLPWLISETYLDSLWLVEGVLGTVLCKLVKITELVSAEVSIFSMVAIAVDRFRAVLFPMKSVLLSQNKCQLIIAKTWVASVALQAHNLYAATAVPHDTGLDCVIQWEPASHTQKMILINLVLKPFLICSSAIVLSVLYSSIINLSTLTENPFSLGK